MKITIKNRKTIKEYIPDEESVLVRITSLDEFKKIDEKMYKEIYLYYFDDIDCESEYSITKEEGKELKEILYKNKDVNEIVIHCDYGKSRSPGVGIAFKELLNEDSKELREKYRDYNEYVIKMIKGEEEEKNEIKKKESIIKKIYKLYKRL